jgi:hypothetical protein
MVDFLKQIHYRKASVLEGHNLLFVHCVLSEPTLLVPMGYRVFSLNAVRFTSVFWIVWISEESLLIVSKSW